MVEDLSTEGVDGSLAVSVRPRRSNRRLDDLHVLGLEHRVEGIGVLAVAISDKEAQRAPAHAEVSGDVAGLLGGPGSCWVR